MRDAIHERLDGAAARVPHRPALICGDQVWTFADIQALSERWARWLTDHGVSRGDRFVVVGRTEMAMYVWVHAASRIGAIAVLVDDRAPQAVRCSHVSACAATVVVTATDTDPDQALMVSQQQCLATQPPTTELKAISSDTPVVQLYSSGTTGDPKGIVLAHRSFTAVPDLLVRHRCTWIDWRDDDVSLSPLPATHIGGLWWTLRALHEGIPTVLAPSAIDGAALMSAINEHRVSITCVVPTVLTAMLATGHPVNSLRLVVYGGSAALSTDVQRARRTWGCAAAQIYGLSETGCTALCLPDDEHNDANLSSGVVGRPYPGVEVKVVAASGECAPPGGVGEVWIRSPASMIGYHNNAEATAATVVDGWVRTGDLGSVDNGLLRLQGRSNHMVIVGGVNVYPEQVDKVLAGSEDVTDVAVVGVSDPDFGNIMHAYVVLREGGSVSNFMKFARSHLEPECRPSRVNTVSVIPRTASGKVQRHKLVGAEQ